MSPGSASVLAFLASVATAAAVNGHAGEVGPASCLATSSGLTSCEELPAGDTQAISLVQIQAKLAQAAAPPAALSSAGATAVMPAVPKGFFQPLVPNRKSIVLVEGKLVAAPFIGCFPAKNGVTWWMNLVC